MRNWFGEQGLGRRRTEPLCCPWGLLLEAPADNGKPLVETVHHTAPPRMWVVVTSNISPRSAGADG